MQKTFNEDISSVLGSKVSYGQDYDPSILVRERRDRNREQYNIYSPLPFIGYDIWNCYEISFLLENGLPLNAVMKIRYSVESDYIVESKSLKLYCNSYNMLIIKGNKETAIKTFREMIKKDLSSLLETDVDVNLFFKEENNSIFEGYVDIETIEDLTLSSFSSFKETPELLQYKDGEQDIHIKTSILRSNCKITHQSDWGDLFIRYRGDKKLDLTSLTKYIVSFRKENHFHEEVVEMIYKRLFDLLSPEELMVAAIYTRRGGIDINPIRANKESLLDENLIDVRKHCLKTIRQ